MNHTTASLDQLTFTINNTVFSPVASRPSDLDDRPFALTNFSLPLGRHEFRVEIGADAWTLYGATVESGLRRNDSTTDVTIDDTAWRTGQIALTDGWNMLETPFEDSNYIDTVGHHPSPGVMGAREANWGHRSWSKRRGPRWRTIGEAVCPLPNELGRQ